MHSSSGSVEVEEIVRITLADANMYSFLLDMLADKILYTRAYRYAIYTPRVAACR